MLLCPPHLQPLLRASLVEETLSALRHELRNKMASVRNSAFYIRRKVERGTALYQEDARVGQFFQLIETELDACNDALRLRTSAAVEGAVPVVDVTQAAAELLRSLELPAGISIEPSAPGVVEASIEKLELQLAAFCIMENAVEAVQSREGGGVVQVRCGVREPDQTFIEVSNPGDLSAKPDDALRALFSTKAGRTGLGLNLAKRVATRYRGKLELAATERGVTVTLLLPKPKPTGGSA